MTSMKISRTAALAAFTCAAVAGLSACQNGYWTSEDRTLSSDTRSTTSTQAYGYTPSTRATESRTMNAQRSGEKAMYFPTGRRETSMLEMRMSGPNEVRLGQPYSYTVHVTNLSQAPLSNVVIRNVHELNQQEYQSEQYQETQSTLGYTAPESSSRSRSLEPRRGEMNRDLDRRTRDADLDVDADVDLRDRDVNDFDDSGDDFNDADADFRLDANMNDRDSGRIRADARVQRDDFARSQQSRTYAQARTNVQNDQSQRNTTQRSRTTGQAEWTIGHLNPGETKTIRIEGEANQPGQIRQCLAVEFLPTMCTSLNVVNPQLEARMTGPQQALACDTLEYTLTVRNVGTGTARNVRLAGDIPSGLTTREGQREMAMTVGELGPGQTREVRIHFRPSTSGEFTLQPTVMSDAGEVRVQGVTTTIQQPALDVQVRGPQWQYIGQPITYEVVVTNNGDGPARNTVIELNAPGLSGNLNSRDLGTLAPGQSKTAEIQTRGFDARASREVPRQIEFNVSARAFCAEAVTESVTTQLRTITALLLETVDTVDPVQVGQNTVYQIAVRNQGQAPARNVRLTARLPEGLEFVSATGESEVRASGNELTFQPLQNLAAGNTARWNVTVRATGTGMVQFELQLHSDELDEPAIETEPTRLFDPNRAGPDAGATPEQPAPAQPRDRSPAAR